MTILSPKKVNQGKQDQESQEANPHSAAHPHQLANAAAPTGSDQHYNQGQLSPGHRWSPHRGEENPLSNETSHDNSNRKRHRASPHRVVRSKRERNQPTPPSTSQGTSEVSHSPVPGPSGGPTDPSGYNSEDEYNLEADAEMTESLWLEKDRMFAKKMNKKGFIIKEMGRDGACLFRAVADQVYGDQEMHTVVRKHCMDYIERNRDHFSQYVTEDFSMYVDRKRKATVHGNHIELQALCEIFNRPVQVFSYKTEPINIFHGMMRTDNEPIRLSYERGHYNSIIDPHKPTVGVGLGLPSFKPGLADQTMMTDALMQSENFEIEQAMLKDKIFASDLEATNIAIEEQVARASYMEWVRETEKRGKSKLNNSPASATVTSGSPRSRSLGGSPVPLDSIRNSPRNSPKAGPSSSNDYDYINITQDFNAPSTSQEPDSSTNSTSSSSQQYFYFEGPSTSSFQGPDWSLNQRNTWSSTSSSSNPNIGSVQSLTVARSPTALSQGSRSPDSSSSQISSKANDSNLRNRIHQLGIGKNQEHRSYRCISSDNIEKMMKRFCGPRNNPSSSPKSHGGNSD